jgi:hypothetical protein
MAQNDLINFGGKDERTLVTFLLIGKEMVFSVLLEMISV